MTTIEGLQEAVSSVATSVGASVVGVTGRRSAGSGVVLAPGRVLTNAHNLWGETITVTFADGRTAEATAAGVDVEGDVAVLNVDTGDTPAIGWNGSSEPAIGTPVFGVANPGGRGLRVTFGLVSGTQRSFRGPRGRTIAGSVEHTAPLLPGSSGGPVVDGDGHLLGINTHRLGEGFYLAIPADDALRSRVDELSKGNTPSRRRLGVGVAPAHVAAKLRSAVGLPEVDGLLVRGAEEGSAAERAGITRGDVLTKAGDRALHDVDDLQAAIDAAGTTLVVEFVRGTESKSVTVEFTD